MKMIKMLIYKIYSLKSLIKWVECLLEVFFHKINKIYDYYRITLFCFYLIIYKYEK